MERLADKLQKVETMKVTAVYYFSMTCLIHCEINLPLSSDSSATEMQIQFVCLSGMAHIHRGSGGPSFVSLH